MRDPQKTMHDLDVWAYLPHFRKPSSVLILAFVVFTRLESIGDICCWMCTQNICQQIRPNFVLLVEVPRMNWTSYPMFSSLYVWFVDICSRCLMMFVYMRFLSLLCANNLWISTHSDFITTIYIYIITMLPAFCHHFIKIITNSKDDMFAFNSIDWLLSYLSWLIGKCQFTIIMRPSVAQLNTSIKLRSSLSISILSPSKPP